MDTNSVLTDEEIIALYFKRDQYAICETNKKYGKFLYRIAYNVLHDNNDCEECKNDAYLNVWNTIPPTRPNNLKAFTAQILRRVAINKYREKHAKKHIPSEYTRSIDELYEAIGEYETAETVYMNNTLGDLLNEFLSELSKRERYLFTGRYYMSETLDTLGKQLNVNSSTVYRELKKLKKKLKEFLERNGYKV